MYTGGSSWEYDCAWHQLRTLQKYLGRQGWGDYSCFMVFISPHFSKEHACPVRQYMPFGCLTAWDKYLPPWRLASTVWSLGLSTSDNNNNNRYKLILWKKLYTKINKFLQLFHIYFHFLQSYHVLPNKRCLKYVPPSAPSHAQIKSSQL